VRAKVVRGGMGLGDALYVQSVVRHLVDTGLRVKVRTAWPDVFSQLGGAVETAPFARAGVDIVAHYSLRKGLEGTTQFEDCCIQAGIRGPVDLRLDWRPTDLDLVQRLRGAGRPIVCVQLPRVPMGRTDGFGAELLPDCRVIQMAIDALRGRALIVQVGAGQALFEFSGIDVDLANRTSVRQLLDVASVADGFLGYCSFIVPLAESFSKPALIVWSSKGLGSLHQYVRRITPQKVLHRETTKAVVDNWRKVDLMAVIDGFLR